MAIVLEVEGADSSGPHLRISLTNRSSKAVTTYRHALPWVGHTSIILIAAKTDATGTTLAANAPIDDPGSETVVIAPGEKLSGTISMTERFPAFRQALKERDVVVFWSYQLSPLEGETLGRTGGCVVFQRAL